MFFGCVHIRRRLAFNQTHFIAYQTSIIIDAGKHRKAFDTVARSGRSSTKFSHFGDKLFWKALKLLTLLFEKGSQITSSSVGGLFCLGWITGF
jgi:hypothetical protein